VGNGERHLGDLLRRAGDTQDPSDALRAITILRGELDRLERDAVACARVAGASWSTIADALSISRQAAQKRHRGVPTTGAPQSASEAVAAVLVTAPARMAVRLARQEARAMGAGIVGTEHLLIGVMRSGDHRAARILEDMGISVDDARAAAQPTLVDGAPRGEPAGTDGFSTYARAVLEQSLREAVARGDAHIGPEHLLLALLRDDVGGAARTLGELGVDPDAIRERLVDTIRTRARGPVRR
jgi:ATP-dependent Clp protease ATP-binding subunit ClpC